MDFEVIRNYVNQFRTAQVATEHHEASAEQKDPEYRKKIELLSRQLPENAVLIQIPMAQYDSEFARLRSDLQGMGLQPSKICKLPVQDECKEMS